jgi:hypothetical protein
MNREFSSMDFVHPHWKHVALLPEEDIKEALITGYKNGNPFAPHLYDFFHAGVKASKILDFGCGIGRNFSALRNISKKIVAYDIPDMVAACRKYADCTSVSLLDDWKEVIIEQFDVTIMTLVLQHMENEEALEKYLIDISNCSDFLYVSTRCWIDGLKKLNSFEVIMGTGRFTFLGANMPQQEILASNFPDHTHYELLFRSVNPELHGNHNSILFYDWAFVELKPVDVRSISLSRVTRNHHWTVQAKETGHAPQYPTINSETISGSSLCDRVLTHFEHDHVDWVLVSSEDQLSWCWDIGHMLLLGEHQCFDLILPKQIAGQLPTSYFIRNSDWSRNLLTVMKEHLGTSNSSPEHIEADFEHAMLCEFYRQNSYGITDRCLFLDKRSVNVFSSCAKGKVDSSATSLNNSNPACNRTLDSKNKKYTAKTIWAFYTCERNIEKKELQIQQWVGEARQDPESLVLFFYGRDASRNSLLGDDEIELEVDESYENLAKKTIAMLKWIDANCDYQHLIKIDDDVAVLDYPSLKEHMSGADYVGSMVKPTSANVYFNFYADYDDDSESVPVHHVPSFYAQGACYGLSVAAVKAIIENENDLAELQQPLAFEDTMIGRTVLEHLKPGLIVRQDPCFAATPRGYSDHWLAVGDLDLVELKLAYEVSGERVEGRFDHLNKVWRNRKTRARVNKYKREYNCGVSKYPALAESENLAEKEVGAIARCVDLYKKYSFKTTCYFSAARQGTRIKALREMKINLQVFTDTSAIREAIREPAMPIYLVVDQSVNIQATADTFADVLMSLPPDSMVLFLDIEATRLSSLFGLEMARCADFEVLKIGLCLVFRKLAT